MNIIPYNQEFIAKCAEFKQAMALKYREISGIKTPELDATGMPIIRDKGTQKYIIEPYMRTKLTELFPGWSLEMAAPLQFHGAEWVTAQVYLVIIDEYLLAFNITPPVRKFYAVDSVRIQYNKGTPHVPENIVDIGDNCMSAVTDAFKRAINRLTGIGDDIYMKRIDLDGSGSAEFVMMNTDNQGTARELFQKFLREHHILDSKAMELLNIKSYTEITDWKEAYETVKSAL